MTDDTKTIEGPVSLVVTREIKPESAADYDKWLLEVGDAARSIDPTLSMTVIKPGGSQTDQYVIILHFSEHEKLEDWENSPVRKKLQDRIQSIEQGKASFSEVTGFEYWFSLPKIAATKPPARYKMAIITVIGLYMMSLIYALSLDVWLDPLHDHLELIIRLVIVVLIMTFILMPLLTRLFARWLYPPSSRGKQDVASSENS